MKVEEAAKKLGIHAVVLRKAMQQEKINIGFAIKNCKRWTYYVNEKLLENYLKGEVQSG